MIVNETAKQKPAYWFETPIGNLVRQSEVQQLNIILPELFGYHIVQYGHFVQSDYLAASRIINKTILLPDTSKINTELNVIQTQPEDLPIAPNSIDVIVLPHVLEYSVDPHKVLREIKRVLIGQGRVIIIGINPVSLWGVWRLLLLCCFKVPLWSGQLRSITRMKDWLSLLDFEVDQVKHFFFLPPLQNKTFLHQLRLLDRLGCYFSPIFSGLFIIVAKKRVLPMSPIKMQWRKREKILGAGAIEPSARDNCC